MSEPLQVIYLDPTSNTYKFDEQRYAEMLLSEEAEKENIRDLPVAIVSIAGDARKGKSFLLNFFLRYLQRYDQEDWIGDENEPLKGFSWRDGVDSETTGIVLWPKPFILTRKDGSRIAVVLMDTQGLFDDETEHEKVAQFHSISTLVSSIQIYNQFGNIQSNDIATLSQFSRYGKKVLKRTGQKPFQKLLFLLRDWPNPREFNYGFKGGNSFLEHKINKQKDKFREKWKELDSCFSDISCFLMPSLGDESEEQEFNGEISKLKPEFVDALRELIPFLLSPDNIVTKSWGQEETPFWRLFNLFKELSDQLTDHNSINVEELDSINKIAEISDAFRLAKLCFLDKVVESMEKNSDIGIAFDSAEKVALELYEDEIKAIPDEDLSDLKRLELITFFSHARENFILDPSWISSHGAVKAAMYNIKWSLLIGTGITVAATLAKLFIFKTL